MALWASRSDDVGIVSLLFRFSAQAAAVDPNSKAPPLPKSQGWGTQPLPPKKYDLNARPRGRRLELARVLVSPALDHDFLVRVELDGVASLRVHVAEETAFPSGEREIGHWRGYTDIDADIACRGFVPELARRRAAGSEERSLVAIRAAL